MHNLFLHVVPDIMNLWFDEKWKVCIHLVNLLVSTCKQEEPFSLWSDLNTINAEYKSIKIPHGRAETPKDLNDRQRWKGMHPPAT
jgi:hypothetical protein